LYIHDVLSSVTTYEKNLRGFDRVHLKAGETRRVTMQVRPQDLSLLNEQMERVVEPGDFEVLIGASSTDIRLKATVTVEGEGAVAQKEEARYPHALGKGESLILPIGSDARPEGVEIRWSKDSQGTFEVQLMSGGGQFLTVGSYPIRSARPGAVYRFRRTNASEMRILITEGRGRIEALRIT
ncbi:MAG: fibronectin type III-like domain-contianing protein, partial [Alistipes sp.]|nr:fibronectin type III-like domain-contianing protein [Alistipes sp.]